MKVLVTAARFDIRLNRPITTGEVMAKSRCVGMSEHHYLAESVLTDSQGEEIGSGNGEFVESGISLSSVFGYE